MYITVSIQEILILMFSFIFPKPIFKKVWIFGGLYSFFFLGLTVYLLFFTNVWIQGVIRDPVRGLQTVIGNGYIWWSLAIWGTLIWSIVNFIFNMRHSKGREKMQVLYLLVGFSLFGIIAAIADIIFPIFYKDTSFFSASTIASLAFNFAVTYVILKHRFLEIRLVVARSVAYVLLVTILGALYTSGLFLTSEFFVKQNTDLPNLIASTILALFIAFTFQPLKMLLEKLTDKIFFRGGYDTQELLSRLGSIMNSYIDLDALSNEVLEVLTREMRVSRGAFIIFGEDLSSIYNIHETGFLKHLVISYSEASFFSPFFETILFDDLEEGSLKNLMREKNVTLVKNLRVKDKIVGILILGEKASGEVYSSQDLKFLDIFSPEVAVAIQDSQSYDKIKRFNATLSEEVKKATADLQQANERLKSLDSLKDDFVSIASHELRTPMTAIRSYAWMALHKADIKLSEKVERYLIRVLMSSERLINLVNDMLNISRIEAGKIEINPEPIDPIVLCKDIFDEAYYSKEVNKKISFNLLEKPVPKIFADPEKLRQVLLNLVGNSLKYTPDGGSITIDFFSDGKLVEILVKDTGTGISKEDIGRLFQKFSRLDNSYVAAATSGGTGLGLYISKKIIELMHGRIWASSEGLGKGATFAFSLPVATQETLQHAQFYTVKPVGEVKPLEPAAL